MKQKAFTLVELLAVIIILGILAVLIVPKVISILSETEKNTNMTSAQNLVKAAQLKASNNDMTGNNRNININYQTGENKSYLDYSGNKPQIGQIQIKSNGEVAMAVKFGDLCYLKRYASDDISAVPYSENTCGANADVFINYEMPALTITGDGLYEAKGEPGRYIYRGSNPNNYINLKEDGTNNTLYRIVSYEPDGKIKVVREEKLFNKEWDEASARFSDGTNNTYCTSENGCNVWGSQETMLYNDSSLGYNFHYFYYASPTATTLSNGASGRVETESTLNKYLNDGSWTDLANLDRYIDSYHWNVGGVYYIEDDKGIIKEKEEEKQLKWNGKVGLMSITEYVEASLNPACTSVRSNYSSESGSSCKELNWTYKNYNQWSLSPRSNSRYLVLYVAPEGFFNHIRVSYAGIGVRPSFYLKSSVRISGLGTNESPYYIVES